MSNVLIWRADEQNLDPTVVEQIFRSEAGFGSIRFNELGGAAIESRFTDAETDNSIFVRLSGKLNAISLTSTSGTSLRAALILQRHLQSPLRIVDTDNSFDLILSDYANFDELNAAIDQARACQ